MSPPLRALPSTLASLLLLALLSACGEPPLTPESPETMKAQARGGEPGPPPDRGPPSTLLLPTGPPPHVPAAVPPGAGPPGFLSDIVEIGAGARFSCALRTDGLAFCWGSNTGGLGDGGPGASSVPVQVVSAAPFSDLAVGNTAACGLTAEGAAYCWGDNRDGLLGAGLSAPGSSVPVSVAGGHEFLDLSVGLVNMCGLATDGVVYCWGGDQGGIMDATSAGGASDVPSAVVSSGSLGLTEVSVGFQHACGLDETGGLHCWGNRLYFGNGESGTSDVPLPSADGLALASIAVGSAYSCGLDPSGAAFCWGPVNLSGALGLGHFGQPVPTPEAVQGGLTFTSLDADNNNNVAGSTCAVAPGGEAWCWGNNTFGQLGVEGGEPCFQDLLLCEPSPVQVSGGIAFESVAMGLLHACAVGADGRAYCWGDNTNGQLGDGTTVGSSSPVTVQGLDADIVDG